MTRRLIAYVHVDGKAYAPGDDVPKEVAAKITNPAAWEGEDTAPEQEATSSDTAEGSSEDPAPSGPSDSGGQEQGKALTPPPRSGAGSGREAWAAYAAAHDVPVRSGAGREEIIEALQAAGVPVDQQPEE